MEDDKILMERIEVFVQENTENIIRDIKTLVDIKSVKEEPKPGAPFGDGPARVLNKALDMAAGMGLSVRNCEGYVGYADLPGKSGEHIAMVTHLDVVPEGNDWKTDPYCMEVRDGFLVGRGTADDKGPAVLTMYAAKFFREKGEELPFTLRLIFGTSEETGMEDMKYYAANYPQPKFCFSPDSRFPVGYAEKGGYNGWLISGPLGEGNLVEFIGGEAKNMVPDKAYALVKADGTKLADTENVTVRSEGDCVRIEGHGKSGHVAGPGDAVNAIGLVVNYLLDYGLCTRKEEEALKMMQRLHASTDGSSIGIASADEVFGPLTCVGGIVELKEGRLRQSIDIRYPASIDDGQIHTAFCKLAESAGGGFEQGAVRVPFFIDPELPEVQILTDAYYAYGGTEKPFTMGGGTYARCFENAVSCGPGELEQPKAEWGGGAHGADECMSIDQLLKALRIYILAIARLMRLRQ